MALTPEEEAELAELEKQVGPEFLKAVPSGGTVTPAPENSLGVTGVINQPEAPLSPEESEAGRIAAALDPRFDLVPQSLALLPATTDPRGDDAAIASYKAGTTGEVKFAYEPPVAIVRKQLLENPAMLHVLRSDPPSPEEIASMDSSSPLYQDAANYMWARTAEKAAEQGHTVYRYSRMPWGKEDDWGLDTLGRKLSGAMQPIVDVKQAIVLGFDDMATLGVGRAAQEKLYPEQKLNVPGNVDVMGVDESKPQKTAEVNEWTAEESPIGYGAGQVGGALVGAPALLYREILAGGSKLARLIAGTRAGALAAKAPEALKGAAGVAGEVAAGAAEAAATQAGQEAVRMTTPRGGSVLQAGERIIDTGQNAALWGLGGSLLGRLAGQGADAVRHSDRLGAGAVGRTENNLDWGLDTVVTGPRLKGDTRAMVRRASVENNEPGDYIAEQIAPPILKKAEERTRRAEGAQRAERSNFYQTTEGGERLPVTNLQVMSLEKLRSHHQPEPGGALHAVDDKSRDAQKVFNRHVQDVSTSPVEGAIKLTPEEAGTFLGRNWRFKLIKDDLAQADARAAQRPVEPVDREAFLRTLGSRERAAVEEEIEASIEDIVGDRTPTAAARAKAEQQVLRDLVEEQSFVEVNGPVGDYLRQRGIDAVYVTPRAYDARRTDTLIEGLTDKDLLEAAKHDRSQRPYQGKRGGYGELREKHAADISEAKKVEESIAPKGSAFKAVARHGKRSRGDKEEADVMRELADEAGVRPDLDRLRSLQETIGVQRQAQGRTASGKSRGLFDPNNWYDVAQLRAFPVLRALEPGGEVTGGMMSRMALMGQIEDESARAAELERAKPAYEKRRTELTRERNDARAKEKSQRERRRTERHRDD